MFNIKNLKCLFHILISGDKCFRSFRVGVPLKYLYVQYIYEPQAHTPVHRIHPLTYPTTNSIARERSFSEWVVGSRGRILFVKRSAFQ